jgi:hypothetical protein
MDFETNESKKIRDTILSVVDNLKAHYPVDPVHFNRMKLKIKSESPNPWFPLGLNASIYRTILQNPGNYSPSLVTYADQVLQLFSL